MKNISNAGILRKFAATRYLTHLQNMPMSAGSSGNNGIIFMKQVKLKYLLSYTLRGIIIRHEHTKDLLSNLTADVQIARQNHVTRNWTKPGTGTYAVLKGTLQSELKLCTGCTLVLG